MSESNAIQKIIPNLTHLAWYQDGDEHYLRDFPFWALVDSRKLWIGREASIIGIVMEENGENVAVEDYVGFKGYVKKAKIIDHRVPLLERLRRLFHPVMGMEYGSRGRESSPKTTTPQYGWEASTQAFAEVSTYFDEIKALTDGRLRDSPGETLLRAMHGDRPMEEIKADVDGIRARIKHPKGLRSLAPKKELSHG